MEIEVYKTSVSTRSDADQIVQKIRSEYPWYRINFDLQDCDRILRVQSGKLGVEHHRIVKLVKSSGHSIERLPD